MARGKVGATEPEVVDAGSSELTQVVTTDDEIFVRDAGIAVKTFLGTLNAFFARARQLEKEAVGRLAKARSLQVPATMEEDVAIQEFIRDATAGTKESIAHWNICQAVSGFHRRLTSTRQRAVDPNEQANAIGNQLHNKYVDNEKRRAAEEQDRLRREAEAQSMADRVKELARQEEMAAKAEADAPLLSERESVFVDLIVAGNKPSLAAQRAGFKNPTTVGPQLLERPKVASAIEAKERAAAIRAQAAATKERPLDVQVETVRPNIAKASGASDRTYHGAKVLDEAALHDAVFAGRFGIPRDVLVVDHSKVNAYGKDLKELINKWPGVQYTKNTKVT